MLKAAGLWEKLNAKGNRYFVGRLGGAKIVILANGDRAGDNNPTHHLFFAEPSQNGVAARLPSESERPPRPIRRRSGYARALEPWPQALPDDRVDDLYSR